MSFHYLKVFLITFPVALGIDLVWLGLVAKGFYDEGFSSFSRTLRWPAVIATYVLLIAGVIFFSTMRTEGKMTHSFLFGALFGLVVYGVYDLTNLATLTDWSLKMTVVDVLWGSFFCGLVSLIAGVVSGFFS